MSRPSSPLTKKEKMDVLSLVANYEMEREGNGNMAFVRRLVGGCPAFINAFEQSCELLAKKEHGVCEAMLFGVWLGIKAIETGHYVPRRLPDKPESVRALINDHKKKRFLTDLLCNAKK